MSPMAPWHNLPTVVLYTVLDQLNDVRQLATCRLVCKSWDPLAERAMFKQKCRFNRPEAQRKYYDHLVKKPALAQLIRHIDILSMNDMSFYVDFLQLAFTPNVKTIDYDQIADDEEDSNGIYNLLLRIAQRNSEEDYTLECLPPPDEWNDLYVDTLLFFKKTLICLEIGYAFDRSDDDEIKAALLDRKDEFESLHTIKLTTGNVKRLKRLEKLLRRCTPIQELKLDLESASTATEMIESKEAFDEWMALHVERDTSVRKLHLSGETFEPGIAYYLLYKYPQLTSVHIDNWMDTDYDDLEFLVMPLIDALKDIRYLSINSDGIHPSSQTHRAFISNLQSQQNILRVARGFSSINVQTFKPIGITEFTITEQPEALEEIISRVSVVSSLDISYGKHGKWKRSNELPSLYRVLEATGPHIQKLAIEDVEIQCPPSSYTPALCNHLSRLEIRGAVMDKLVLSNLSTIAPNLQYLILNTCLFEANCHQNCHVVMPHTDFKCLSIVTSNVPGPSEQVIAWLKQEIDIKDCQMMTMQITTLNDQQTHYFVLKAGIPTQFKQISLKDYTQIADKLPKTVIECKSIQYIKFGLGKLMNVIVNVKAAKETGRIQPLGDWNQSCQAAISAFLVDEASSLKLGLYHTLKMSPADDDYFEKLQCVLTILRSE